MKVCNVNATSAGEEVMMVQNRAGTNVCNQLRSFGGVIFELFEPSCVVGVKYIGVIEHDNVVVLFVQSITCRLTAAMLVGWYYQAYKQVENNPTCTTWNLGWHHKQEVIHFVLTNNNTFFNSVHVKLYYHISI